MSMTAVTSGEVNEISYVAMDSVAFAFRNSRDLQRIADGFCGGSFSEAVKLCLSNGLNSMLNLCDMSDEVSE